MSLAIAALLAVVALSALGGWLLSAGKAVEKPVKAMIFVGYFWLLAFVQLLLIASAYFVWRRFLI